MVFMCNKCYKIMAGAETRNEGASYMTSCLHIFCSSCSQEIENNMCAACNKICKMVKITKDMPPAVKSYFEPPLAKLEQFQQQIRFLRSQQELAMHLRDEVVKEEKEATNRIQRLSEFEKAVEIEKNRLEASIKEKHEVYKRVKEQYQKVFTEEERQNKYYAEQGFSTAKDDSIDSGMFSSNKSSRFEH